MQSFFVMQGETYQEEKELGIIWSPQQDSGGQDTPFMVADEGSK